MEDQDTGGQYIIPKKKGAASPVAICRRLLRECGEFSHLVEGEAKIAFLLSVAEVIRDGKQVLGTAHLPTVQGRLRGVFEWAIAQVFGYPPDFIITLDYGFWEEASQKEREILVFHELCHCIHKTDRDGEPRFNEEGGPVWGIVAHDVEEFNATVARYGPYSEEIRQFIRAAEMGDS